MIADIKVMIGDLIFEGQPGDIRNAILAAKLPEIIGVSAIMAVTKDSDECIFGGIIDEEIMPFALNEALDTLKGLEEGIVTVEELIAENQEEEEKE